MILKRKLYAEKSLLDVQRDNKKYNNSINLLQDLDKDITKSDKKVNLGYSNRSIRADQKKWQKYGEKVDKMASKQIASSHDKKAARNRVRSNIKKSVKRAFKSPLLLTQEDPETGKKKLVKYGLGDRIRDVVGNIKNARKSYKGYRDYYKRNRIYYQNQPDYSKRELDILNARDNVYGKYAGKMHKKVLHDYMDDKEI